LPLDAFSIYFKGKYIPFFEFERSDIKPKFMTQGSFAYNTINTPENPPVQQMDLDAIFHYHYM
jgi:hypothetical protein